MSSFPQPPLNDKSNPLSRAWHLWHDRLAKFLSDTSGLIPWSSVNKAGAKLTDIPERFHNSTQVIQGGTADEYYHLTANQFTELTDGGDTTLHTHAHNTLVSIDGGTAGEYYHLTAAQHTDLTDGGQTSLHKHDHNAQDGLQGGTAAQFYHLTSAEYSELQRGDNVASVAANTTLDDTYRTVYVTATGKVITLPAASAARIGKDWTVILGTTGYTDIVRAGSDTLTLPTNDTTIRIDNKGASITLRCLTASSWGIA